MPKKLPEDIFLYTFTLVPRIACNILIENHRKELLLTKRSIPPGLNLWHYPGSFILKDESISVCLKRLTENELGIKLSEKPILAGVFENLTGDPRGHVIDILYKLHVPGSVSFHTTRETKEIRFFSTLPDDIGFGQKEILNQLGYT